MKISLRHPKATVPVRSTDHAAGYDMTVAEVLEANSIDFWVDTGVAMAIPEGFVGLVFMRSSISKMATLTLANAVGVIDPDYRGTIQARFRRSHTWEKYEIGERCVQIVFLAVMHPKEFEIVDELPESVRGGGGFGSTGS